jgi:myo-inositol-1(or 4)-monophosphatase
MKMGFLNDIHPVSDLKDTLITALKTSGKILLEFFDTPLDVTQKESQSSIVTIADFKSDSVITEIIREKFPAHNLISEESGFRDNNSEYTWIIDPLDGTSNFASGIPWFGVLITLFQKDIPVMGGAYLPVQDLLYFAEKGKGVFKNDMLLPAIKKTQMSDSLIAFCVDYSEDRALLDQEIEIYKQIVLNSRNTRTTNSLIDFIYVAEGKFGGVLNFNTKVWDIAGLGLIISEAGGWMKYPDGSDITFTINAELINVNFPVMAGSAQFIDSMNVLMNKSSILKSTLRI